MTKLPLELEANIQVLVNRYTGGAWEEKYLNNDLLDFARACYAAGWQAGAEAMRDECAKDPYNIDIAKVPEPGK